MPKRSRISDVASTAAGVSPPPQQRNRREGSGGGGNLAGRAGSFPVPPPFSSGGGGGSGAAAAAKAAERPKLTKKSATALLGGGEPMSELGGGRSSYPRRESEKRIMERHDARASSQPPSRLAAQSAESSATGAGWNARIKHHGKPPPPLHALDSVRPQQQQQQQATPGLVATIPESGEPATQQPMEKARTSPPSTKNPFFASDSDDSDDNDDDDSSALVDRLKAELKPDGLKRVLHAAGLDNIVDLTGDEECEQHATSRSREGNSKKGGDERPSRQEGGDGAESNDSTSPDQGEGEDRPGATSSRRSNQSGGGSTGSGRLNPPLSSSSLDVSSRSFVVTGGTQGLGLEIARHLKRHGAVGLALVSRSADRGREACEELNDSKCRCVFVCADLARADEASSVVSRANKALKGDGPITGVVNAAAVTARGNVFNETADGFDEQMAVNARAPFLVTQAFAREMKKNKLAGSIVNICSVAAYGGAPFIMAYSASKAALVCMVKTNAAELAPIGVRVNGVNMGQCLTENEDKLQRSQTDENWADRADSNVPLGRILRPEDVAPTVVFLLSDASAMITGSVVALHPDFAHGMVSLLSEDVR